MYVNYLSKEIKHKCRTSGRLLLKIQEVFFAALTKHFLPSFNFRSTSEVGKLFHNCIPLSFIDILIFFV